MTPPIARLFPEKLLRFLAHHPGLSRPMSISPPNPIPTLDSWLVRRQSTYDRVCVTGRLSPFDRLPLELHAEIFSHVLPPFPHIDAHDETPMVIAKVCGTWRSPCPLHTKAVGLLRDRSTGLPRRRVPRAPEPDTVKSLEFPVQALGSSDLANTTVSPTARRRPFEPSPSQLILAHIDRIDVHSLHERVRGSAGKGLWCPLGKLCPHRIGDTDDASPAPTPKSTCSWPTAHYPVAQKSPEEYRAPTEHMSLRSPHAIDLPHLHPDPLTPSRRHLQSADPSLGAIAIPQTNVCETLGIRSPSSSRCCTVTCECDPRDLASASLQASTVLYVVRKVNEGADWLSKRGTKNKVYEIARKEGKELKHE
ncbi:hypothetical protein NMY22_g9174 [Coprinellus aureogranulatus]|nr:hypothetical protein NMY22_g9174 [Coprinellus aureogranulatus]